MFPSYVVQAFRVIQTNADEYEYYGACNGVLNTVFPISEGYVISPQWPAGHINAREKDDFVGLFTVSKNSAAVFFVEINAPRYLESRYNRDLADGLMRTRFLQLYETYNSEIHAVSAFGTHVAFYEVNKKDDRVKPPPVAQSNSNYFANTDTAPQEWWQWDILDDDGYSRFMQVVQLVKSLNDNERTLHITTHPDGFEMAGNHDVTGR